MQLPPAVDRSPHIMCLAACQLQCHHAMQQCSCHPRQLCNRSTHAEGLYCQCVDLNKCCPCEGVENRVTWPAIAATLLSHCIGAIHLAYTSEVQKQHVPPAALLTVSASVRPAVPRAVPPAVLPAVPPVVILCTTCSYECQAACGVKSQAFLREASAPFLLSRVPGCMQEQQTAHL